MTTTQLEEELGAALAARAAGLPQSATVRLRAIDYHPRRRRRGVPVGVGAGVAGAATAGTVVAVLLGGAAPAYAGWTAAPSAGSAGSTTPPAATASSCQSQLASLHAPPGAASPGPWQSVLTDVRGPFTVALFEAGNDDAACFTGPGFIEVNQISSASDGSGGSLSGVLSVQGSGAPSGSAPAAGQNAVILEGTSSGDLNQVVENNLTTSSDGPYTLVDGRVADGVTGVTLVRSDGQDVVASVSDGWFVAWWPGNSATANSAQVTKGSATSSEQLVPSNKLAPPGSCTSTSGSAAHCASSGGGQIRTGNSGNSGNSGSVGNSGNSGSHVAPSGDSGGTGPAPSKP